MHKNDLGEAIRKSLDAVGDSIVNPRCDECSTHLPTPMPHEIGLPRLCSICTVLVQRDFRRRASDYRSQERPRGRTIHVVRLPEGMTREKP